LQRSQEAGYKPMAVVVLDVAGHVKSAQPQSGIRIDGNLWRQTDTREPASLRQAIARNVWFAHFMSS